jgi:hypothetical protein
LWLSASVVLFTPKSQPTLHLLRCQICFLLNLNYLISQKAVWFQPWSFLQSWVQVKYRIEIATDLRKSSILMAVLIPVPRCTQVAIRLAKRYWVFLMVVFQCRNTTAEAAANACSFHVSPSLPQIQEMQVENFVHMSFCWTLPEFLDLMPRVCAGQLCLPIVLAPRHTMPCTQSIFFLKIRRSLSFCYLRCRFCAWKLCALTAARLAQSPLGTDIHMVWSLPSLVSNQYKLGLRCLQVGLFSASLTLRSKALQDTTFRQAASNGKQ